MSHFPYFELILQLAREWSNRLSWFFHRWSQSSIDWKLNIPKLIWNPLKICNARIGILRWWIAGQNVMKKHEHNFCLLNLCYIIGICPKIAHTNPTHLNWTHNVKLSLTNRPLTVPEEGRYVDGENYTIIECECELFKNPQGCLLCLHCHEI